MNTKQSQKIIQISLFCLFICLQAMIMAACKSAAPAGGVNPEQEAAEYVSLSKERSVLLYPQTPDTSPKLDIALSVVDSKQPEKQFIMDVLYEGQGVEEYADKRLHGYDTMYGEMRSVAEKHPDMSRESLNWFYNETVAYHAGTPRVAVFSRKTESFFSGAHGMQTKDYYVFNLEDKRRLSLRDIIRDDAKQALEDLVEEALRKHMEIPSWIPLSEGGFFEDSVDRPEDFFVSPGGLGFQWDPYEIAPYSAGIIEVIFPYDQIQGLFTDLGLYLTNGFR
ncbi:hypothetical protein AGMMS49940_05760 [Spirochaetia bacterium]|nr:hypothetical protein AGMMS49940_05760 [Spirochaetia bacterium]